MAFESKDELKAILYARHERPPELIGLPENGILTHSADVALAKSLHHMFSDDVSDTSFRLPRYKTARHTIEPDVTARDTYRYKLAHSNHYTDGVEGNADSATQQRDQINRIKRAAYETLCLHAELAGLFKPERAADLNALVQKGGFADFTTFETLLCYTPVAAPSLKELMIDTTNEIQARLTGQLSWPHNERTHTSRRGVELMRQVRDMKIITQLPDPVQPYAYVSGSDIPKTYLPADPGLTYKF